MRGHTNRGFGDGWAIFIALCTAYRATSAFPTHGRSPCTPQPWSNVGSKEVDIWRIKPFQVEAPHYAYQYLYLPVLLNIISIKMKIMDFRDLIVRRDEIPVNPPTSMQLFTFLTTKAIHFSYRVILPYFYISWPSLLLLNILSELVMGFWMGFVTQVSHLNTVALYPNPKSSSFDMTWSEMQVMTTVDYATESMLWNFLTGGLNSQVIHHLFPWILSVYYKDLNPILAKTCTEFGVKYNRFSGMWTMWSSYNQYLKDMGQSRPHEDIKSKVFWFIHSLNYFCFMHHVFHSILVWHRARSKTKRSCKC